MIEGCDKQSQTYSKCEDDQWGEYSSFIEDCGLGRNTKSRMRFCRLTKDCIIVQKYMVQCDDQPFGDFGEMCKI